MTIVQAVDSYAPPTNEQLQQAKAAGIRMWNGYLSNPQDPGIDSVWSAADFQRIAAVLGPVWYGGHAYNGLAYCSGDADPGVCQRLGALWNVLICLDVENSIRAYGSWTQPWIDTAGICGVYGNIGVQVVRASFHVLAAWVTDEPTTTWPTTAVRPDTPCGWQWKGNVPMLGSTVDRNVFDVSFITAPLPPTEDDVYGFFLEASGDPNQGNFVEFPGVRAGMTFHLASQDRTGKTGNVVMVFATDASTPTTNKTVTLTGTLPGKHGPTTVDVPAADLAGTNSGSLTFMNEGAFRVMVTVTIP